MTPWEKAKAEAEEKRVAHLRAVLQAAIDEHGNRQQAAYKLGMSGAAFYQACDRLGVDLTRVPDKRGGTAKGQIKRSAVVALKRAGMSHGEIAAALGSTKGAVSMHLSRDRQERRAAR